MAVFKSQLISSLFKTREDKTKISAGSMHINFRVRNQNFWNEKVDENQF